ncbi:polysaccharide biosynthesis protein [Thiothrix subterranea]|uniref:Nucleoside-diphosphate sugar epimerase/dehydratase n=1 Tax=Thiothrix subterranea TaxID=2735563 RepID=A0AA51MRE5_9GAMM|nr:nucleoside-diphosphate sugar epimerase/dehydratase [Thiothrix subterranea]MDQ5767574.1 nucleoside-diphosphate sugar epimerase/dehydratase [Thiothrix subterranea]QQZ29901.1 polysaccharide biosynthesis protein [Thiothrix subterranea]WML88544.1 nucleoside-diphosphate sugar epimerase/dehydratase [Thiothrix subterranea]
MNTQKSAYKHLLALPRWQKRIIMLGADTVLLTLAVWISFAMRFGTWQPNLQDGQWLMIAAPLVTIPLFVTLGLYRAIVRFMGGEALLAVIQGITVSAVLLGTMALLFDWNGIPRSFYPIYWGTALFLVGSSRYLIRHHHQTSQYKNGHIRVAIYGAGQSGIQLAATLASMPEYRVAIFVDDNPALHKAVIHGVRVHAMEELPHLIATRHIQQVLLAMPSVSHQRRREIVESLDHLSVHVRTIPELSDLVSGERSIAELREIGIDELLGRSSVAPKADLLSQCITNKAVMVTGAGGSIGSELCRQIVRLQPTRLVLFELSEFALYQIEQELLNLCRHEHLSVPIIPMLGSVQDYQRVEEALRQHGINTLYHAAAYKHVPMVEHNPIEGLRNNVFGTLQAAKAARAEGVERFILISTDKAVRPTNVMGASKRMAELVLQGLAKMPGDTVFSMVRFGNVLGSSGSVVPLFREQIRKGGPITVTHPDIIRYFMTIPEAAQLVIQAGAMATGGEVFVLDMGEPVKIVDLAKRMVNLSGLTLQTEAHPQGDIALSFSGLRPGEKLYEELLIGESPQTTSHPRIFMAHEACMEWADVTKMLDSLDTDCRQRNLAKVYRLLHSHIQGFKHPGVTPDISAQKATSCVIPFPVKLEGVA